MNEYESKKDRCEREREKAIASLVDLIRQGIIDPDDVEDLDTLMKHFAAESIEDFEQKVIVRMSITQFALLLAFYAGGKPYVMDEIVRQMQKWLDENEGDDE